MAQVQPLERLLHRLVAGEAGPFVMAGAGVHGRHLQIGPGLLQPVGGAVHRFIVGEAHRSMPDGLPIRLPA